MADASTSASGAASASTATTDSKSKPAAAEEKKEDAKEEMVAPGAPPERKLHKPVFVKLDTLDPNMQRKGVNIVGKVVGDGVLKINREMLDGKVLRVVSYLVGDKTGVMELHLRNEQIDTVKKDDVVIMRNVTVAISDSRMYLKCDEFGLIEVAQPEQYQEEIDMKNNLSTIEWELVST